MSVRNITGTVFDEISVSRRDIIEGDSIVTRYYVRSGYIILTQEGDTWDKAIEKTVPPGQEAKAVALFEIMQSLIDQKESL